MKASRGRDNEHVYPPTSGTVSGWLGLVIVAMFVLAVLLTDRSVHGLPYAFAALLFGLLLWCYMLRPHVVIGETEVELRNAFSSWHVPLAGVRSVSVRAVTMVVTDEGRYDGVAVGRPARTLYRGGQQKTQFMALPGQTIRLPNEPEATRLQRGQLDATAAADLLIEQILFGADHARETGQAAGPVRRTWAVLELAGLVVLVVGLVLTLVL